MLYNVCVPFRTNAAQREKLSGLARQMNMSVSDILRLLVANAEVVEVRKREPVAKLVVKKNESADDSQNHGAFVE